MTSQLKTRECVLCWRRRRVRFMAKRSESGLWKCRSQDSCYASMHARIRRGLAMAAVEFEPHD